jgi:hypothetical protein
MGTSSIDRALSQLICLTSSMVTKNGCYNDLDTSSENLPVDFTAKVNSFDKAEVCHIYLFWWLEN